MSAIEKSRAYGRRLLVRSSSSRRGRDTEVRVSVGGRQDEITVSSTRKVKSRRSNRRKSPRLARQGKDIETQHRDGCCVKVVLGCDASTGQGGVNVTIDAGKGRGHLKQDEVFTVASSDSDSGEEDHTFLDLSFEDECKSDSEVSVCDVRGSAMGREGTLQFTLVSDKRCQEMRDRLTGTRDEVVVKKVKALHLKSTIEVHAPSLASLMDPGEQLNGEIIDVLVAMMMSRYPPEQTGVYVFGTFLFKMLTSFLPASASRRAVNLENVQGWLKHVTRDQAIQIDVILVPVNVKGVHWVVWKGDLVNKCVSIYDPNSRAVFAPDDMKCIPRLGKWLHDFMEKKVGPEYAASLDITNWTLSRTGRSSEMHGFPRQDDSVSCGLFVVLFCMANVMKTSQEIGQDDMHDVRMTMADCIMKDSLKAFTRST